MPTYEYLCESCNHKFEHFLPISKRLIPEQDACPSCKNAGKVVLCFSLGIQDRLIEAPLKRDKGFKEVLQKIAQHHPKHTMNI